MNFEPVTVRTQPDEEDVFCPNCGARNPKGTAYCMGCGKMLG